MLSQADMPIEDAMEAFAEFGVEAAYFVPTKTGIGKAIIDAHAGIRSFLASRAVHDYAAQAQGPAAKRVIPIDVVHRDRLECRSVSLYRPNTKQGDPRLWIGRLADYGVAGNLMALLVASDGRLALVNCSSPGLLGSRHEPGSPLNRWLNMNRLDGPATELLGLLTGVAQRGYVESMRPGDTGVGFTLETLLGIKANSSRDPDFKGIELKAARMERSGGSRNRKNLFSQIPDWKASRYKSGRELLQAFGDVDPNTGLRSLYCTVTSRPNPRGIFFATEAEADLVEHRVVRDDISSDEVVRWPLSSLQGALARKHRETFWVGAKVGRSPNGAEAFHYVRVVHTQAPMVANFLPLVESGRISMDYTLRERKGGGARDHGYLFKIAPSHHHLLFPKSSTYDLTALVQ